MMFKKNKKRIYNLISLILVILFLCNFLYSCINIPKNIIFGNLNEDQFIELQNNVNFKAVKSTIKITTKIKSKNELGSGVIIQARKVGNINEYFALTNYHVIQDATMASGYSQKRAILDYKNNEINDYVVEFLERNYDLALISFKSEGDLLPALKLAKNNPRRNELVIALGYPLGQVNSVTYGKVIDYKKIKIKDKNNQEKEVVFLPISHSAPGNAGSSGGPLINKNLELVGLNFAGGEEEDNAGYSKDMYAIPIEEIRSFITEIINRS